MGSLLMLAAPLVVAIAVVAMGMAAYSFLTPDRSASDRIAQLTGGPDEAVRPRNQRLAQFAQQAAKLAIQDEEQITALRKRLLQAGYREKNAAEVYSALRTVGALVGAVIGVLLYYLVAKNSSLPTLIFFSLAGTAAGYYVPAIWVHNSLQKRQTELLRAFPDALDLLVSCVEAGLGLDAAFRRVAEEMASSAELLSREFQLVNHEVSAGITRAEAMHRLADRTGVEEIHQLVSVLVQAERFGTSVARSLRVHSELVRTRRMQRAEEKAAQVSPKLTIVMIVCILPCLIVVLIGPAVINVKNILMPTIEAPP